MSGLIDTIVRRRRASASSRLGPPPEALERVPWTEPTLAPPPVDDPPPPEPAYDQPQPVPAQEYDDAPEPEYEYDHEPEYEPEPEPAPEPASSMPDPEPTYEPEPELAYQAEPEPEPEPPPPPRARTPQPLEDAYRYPPLRERVALRRRARHLAAVREIQLRDLGGFLVELHRFGQRRPDLIQAKLKAAAATDAQWRDLHHQLDQEAPIGELRTPGIGGACSQCGAVHGSLDSFCASCGEPLR